MSARGIDIEQDLAFQRREWAIQRVGTWVIGAFVVSAALGFFGAGGAFSRARAGALRGTSWVEYDRFARVGAPARLEIHWSAASTEASERKVTINRAYFGTIRVERIIPEPEQIILGSERVTLTFSADSIEPGGVVLLDYQPDNAGSQRIEVQVDELAPVSLTQFAHF